MPNIQWDSPASLMRVTSFSTADSSEELIGRGTLTELVGTFLALAPDQQDGALIRAAGPTWSQEFDEDAIRELAARPEFTGAFGDFDTASLPEDADGDEEEFDEAATQDGADGGTTH